MLDFTSQPGLLLVLLVTLVGLMIMPKANPKQDNIRALLQGTAKWSATQDNNPMIRLLHANYAAGYLSALTDIATQSEIEVEAGVSLKWLQNKVQTMQDECTMLLVRLCPQLKS